GAPGRSGRPPPRHPRPFPRRRPPRPRRQRQRRPQSPTPCRTGCGRPGGPPR
ncbi:tRNA pseudouridine(38-40) synthase TruA, partial [Actinomadura logoneensis]